MFFINSEIEPSGGEFSVQLRVHSPLGGSARTVHTRTLYIILTHAAFWAFRFSASDLVLVFLLPFFRFFFFFFLALQHFPLGSAGLITLFSLDGVGVGDGDEDEDGDREPCVA